MLRSTLTLINTFSAGSASPRMNIGHNDTTQYLWQEMWCGVALMSSAFSQDDQNRRREWRKLASVIVGRCPKKYGIKDGMVLPQVGPMAKDYPPFKGDNSLIYLLDSLVTGRRSDFDLSYFPTPQNDRIWDVSEMVLAFSILGRKTTIF
eukprot:TRINITY_DN4728_c0_g1_i1.p1 TRINITY_DN4728_c0_g1~~TRINITY_DN4728_c0_g1_i1.p1  ORF type:complete len:149 (+),score=22.40 TRINITY_DN4728_c0_g1_i1:703-1149(+)